MHCRVFFLHVISLFLILITSTLSTPQLCYTDAGKVAPEYIVPCWTSNDTPHYSCWKAGNKCLKHNACYDPGTGNTYQYGCTDSSYKDSTFCPSKCGLDRERSSWVGLVYCNGTDGLPDRTWICNHPDNCRGCATHTPWNPKLEKLSETHCEDLKHDGQYVAFNEVGTISDTVPLPPETDLPEYFSINAAKWDTITTTTEASTSVPTNPSAGILEPVWSSHGPLSSSPATPLATQTAVSPSGAPKSHVYAMAIGLGVGIPAILAVVGFFAFHCHKRRSRASVEMQLGGSRGAATQHSPQTPYSSVEKPEWKVELPADGTNQGTPDTPSQVSEMEGSVVGDRASYQSPYVSPLLSHFPGTGYAEEGRVSGIHYSGMAELPE